MPSAVICSICTGGGSVLVSIRDGSIKLSVSPFTNHIFPSDDLVTSGLKP